MWETERQLETTVGPDAIWRAWSDVARWPEWNADIERVELTGPFAAGSTITMRPHDDDPVTLRLSEVVEGKGFVDEADVAGTVVRTEHRIDRLDGGRWRVVYRLQATGPLESAIGPGI